ncbi:VCBS repeat-containing protein [Porifericola rhodea]|uniref:VCBS repeat-containing protein n=1 Tax=Porifericola rhodea TaxID=930972 RepID=UPI0026658FFE|nr:VCBS repeat-containing protein [Porifericola rhodea]WKN29698.1 VCBS repeat-containing protein [Porifericola rhodea]
MKKYRLLSYVLLFSCGAVITFCNRLLPDDQLFEQLSSDDTGILFSNTITENDSINVLNYYYCYNGGGVGIGDFNQDGWEDIFFTANMNSSQLYLNRGNFKFKDVTLNAGVSTQQWVTGVSVVDINADDRLDIYLNVAGPIAEKRYPNLLFVNQGNDAAGVPLFKEQAAAYGLADPSYSVQSVFLDYDRDGDLDMYLMTNTVNFIDKSYVHDKNYPITEGKTVDKLYENIGFSDSLQHPLYVEVSEKAGIIHEGYGLGLAVDDLNGDDWPDIYVANDFMPNDLVYINQQDGTFKDISELSQRHQSYNGMGVDICDVNNDLLPDVMVVDMLPEYNERRKTTIAEMNYERFRRELGAGYVPQFMRNTLQLNRGNDADGVTHFADVSQLSGVHATDWSWSPLIADFDNDGLRDIYITNGFVKDVTNLDFGRYLASSSMFGTDVHKKEKKRELARQLKSVKVSNYLYRNQGELSYQDKSDAWGVSTPSFSNGAAYADLDKDGDLDLVVNNINEEAFIFKNLSEKREEKTHSIRLKLKGEKYNKAGIGAKIYVYYSGGKQYYYYMPTRGYLSSMHTPVHIGLGKYHTADSIRVVWPDGKYHIFKNVQADKDLLIDYQKANIPEDSKPLGASQPIFVQVNDSCKVQYTHHENNYIDFNAEPLLPKMYSRAGPAVVAAQVDDKPGIDFIVGGAKGQPVTLFLQNQDASFSEYNILEEDVEYEDMGMLLFDYDLDGDNDLYVVSGGSEYSPAALEYQDRLYKNDGRGNFSPASGVLPTISSSGSCVSGADYDKDGDIDLFVGGRYSPAAYPKAPRSYLLQNNTRNFKDISHTAEGLGHIGMVSDAVWTDFNNDSWIDLIVVGEWMPVTFFQNQNGTLVNVTESLDLEDTYGWWNSIHAVDLDLDGDMDYVLGNAGTNIDYAPKADQPLNVYAYDFDANGKSDPLMARYLPNFANEDKLYPFHSRDDLFRQLVSLKKNYQDYEAYAQAEIGEVIPRSLLNRADKYTATRFESSILINKGNGQFDMRALPTEAQFSAVLGILSGDYNQDGYPDLLLTGNSYVNEVLYGWQDASLGLLLLGDGDLKFKAAAPPESGLFLKGDTRGLANLYDLKSRQVILSPVNGDSLVLLSSTLSEGKKLVRAQPQDAYALLTFKDGRISKQELTYGSAYLDQAERCITISDKIKSVQIVDYKGNRRELNF